MDAVESILRRSSHASDWRMLCTAIHSLTVPSSSTHPPHLTSPHLTSPHLTSPHITSQHVRTPHQPSSPQQDNTDAQRRRQFDVFVGSSVRCSLFVVRCSSVRRFVVRSFVVRSFVRLFVRWLIVRSFVRLFVYSFIRSFVCRLFVDRLPFGDHCSFVSLVRSFVSFVRFVAGVFFFAGVCLRRRRRRRGVAHSLGRIRSSPHGRCPEHNCVQGDLIGTSSFTVSPHKIVGS